MRHTNRYPLRTLAIAVLRAAGSTEIGCAGQGCQGGRRPERCNCGLMRSTPASAAERTAASAWLQIEHSEQPGHPPARCPGAATTRGAHRHHLPMPWTSHHLVIATAAVAALAALLWVAEACSTLAP